MSIPVKIGGAPIAREDQLEALAKAQFILSRTQGMNEEDLLNSLGFLIQTEDRETFNFLLRDLSAAYMDPQQNSEAIVKTIAYYCKAYSLFREEALKFYGTAISDTRKKIFHFKILRYLFKDGIYTLNDIKYVLSKYPKQFENQYFLLFFHFTPELEVDDPEQFNQILAQITDFDLLSQSYRDLIQPYINEPLTTSRFNKHRKWIKTAAYLDSGFEEGSIIEKLIKRHEETIQSISRTDDFQLPPNPLYPNQWLSLRPHILMICAYLGIAQPIILQTYKCARLKDFSNNSISYYAAAGGNTTILEHLAKNHILSGKNGEESGTEENQVIYRQFTHELGAIGTHAAVQASLYTEKPPSKNHAVLAAAATNRRLDALYWLLENTDVTQADLDDALIEAARSNFIAGVQLLKIKGANINARGVDGETPLHAACESGSIETAKALLITPGIDYDKKNDKRQTILHMAAYSGSGRLFKLIDEIQGFDSSAIDNYRNTAKTIFENTVKDLPPAL